MKKNVMIFGCSCFVSEIAGLFYPNKVTTMILSIDYDVKKGGVMYDSFKTGHVKKLYVKKRGEGLFGNPIIPNYIDYFFYVLKSFIMLPYMLFKYDVFIFQGPPFFESIMTPVLRLFAKKVIIYSNDAMTQVALDKKNVGILKKLMILVAKLMEDFSVLFANKVFAVSRFLVDYYKGVNKNVVHVPNGADIESIDKIKPKRRFKEYTVAYLGGFEYFRGIDLLIDAFLKLDFNAKLFLMGGGPDLDRVKKHAAGNKDIVFTGFIEHTEAMGYIKGADIAVMPSRNTVSSQTISSIKCFEYVACEVPHIVTDSGEHAYWTKKYDTGLVVKDSAEEISKAISRLMNDKGLYDRLVSNCKKHKKDIDYKKLKKPVIEYALR